MENLIEILEEILVYAGNHPEFPQRLNDRVSDTLVQLKYETPLNQTGTVFENPVASARPDTEVVEGSAGQT